MTKKYLLFEQSRIYDLIVNISIIFIFLYFLLTPIFMIFFNYQMGSLAGGRFENINSNSFNKLFFFGLFFLGSFIFYSKITKKFFLRYLPKEIKIYPLFKSLEIHLLSIPTLIFIKSYFSDFNYLYKLIYIIILLVFASYLVSLRININGLYIRIIILFLSSLLIYFLDGFQRDLTFLLIFNFLIFEFHDIYFEILKLKNLEKPKIIRSIVIGIVLIFSCFLTFYFFTYIGQNRYSGEENINALNFLDRIRKVGLGEFDQVWLNSIEILDRNLVLNTKKIWGAIFLNPIPFINNILGVKDVSAEFIKNYFSLRGIFDIDGSDGLCFGMLTSFVLISSSPGSAFLFSLLFLISIFITLLIINLQSKFLKNNILIIFFIMNLFNDFRNYPLYSFSLVSDIFLLISLIKLLKNDFLIRNN